MNNRRSKDYEQRKSKRDRRLHGFGGYTEHQLRLLGFDIPELCDKFGLPLEWFYEHNDDICRELDERDEVADYEQNYDWNNHPLDYDLVYYTDFCHFEEA